jgi:hypothetical protein
MSRQGLLLKALSASLIVSLTVLCCLVVKPTLAKTDEAFEVVKTADFEGVIIPREKARDFMRAFSGMEEKDAWTPNKDDVLKLEEKIEAYLKKAAAKRSPNLWSKLAQYKRQYIGIMRNNRRVIYANFFCDSFDKDWKTKPVMVDDGGDCFFRVIYEPVSAAFSDLQINGEA